MIILGINDGHEASACLLRDGHIIAACEEESFTRIKSYLGFPRQSITEVLRLGGVNARDIDHVAVGTMDFEYHSFVIKKYPYFNIPEFLFEQEHYWKPKLSGKPVDPYVKVMDRFIEMEGTGYDMKKLSPSATPADMRVLRAETLTSFLGVGYENIHFVDHHLCHAHHAYYSSPVREDALVLTIDGYGDHCNASVGFVKKGKYTRIFSTETCNLGRIYSFITLLLRMKPAQHEYKVMGLAAYAKPHMIEEPYQVFKKTLYVDGLDFKYHEKVYDHYEYFAERLTPYRFDAIAGALQRFTEELMVDWVRNAVAATGLGTVVMSGGVSLNIKACKLIGELPEVKDLFVCLGGGDASISIGAAQKIHSDLADAATLAPVPTPYLGASFSEADIEEALNDPFVKEHYDVIRGAAHKLVAELLQQGKVVAIMFDRMEFGPRALGHRSLIADPHNIHSVKRINDAIKNRDFWMPFAPSILAEREKDYIINPKGLRAPYMTLAFDTTEAAQKDLLAALHPNDFTARPQLITREANPDFYEIVKEFEKLTGIGGVLNTSFNIHGKPIVCKPIEAVKEIFEHPTVNLDYLLMNNTLLKRKGLL